ncbi:MAG: phosphoribosylformylglycinamidine cyclo-ligase, partial [Candidatus Omnitrophica bacterium]|nr:phosphoribosylformylglycinamidine cyclo-ligase [Candidatus Omnitrophota bacterium]
DSWLARMRVLVQSTHGPGIMPDRGQFAGLFKMSAVGMRRPILVASTDGVGTKLKVAQLVGLHESIGIDAVAMNVNDILVYGAKPLFFLDYLAVGHLQPALMSQLLRGIVRGCRQSGCVLLGGETAEMPGVYSKGEYDIAGFCVGAVEQEKLLDGKKVRAGDVFIGLASNGVHANGFSLVRRALTRTQLKSYSRQLLAPTRIYVQPILKALRTIPIRAMAHITGGGLSRRLPSLVKATPGLAVRLLKESWRVPSIFQVIQAAGGISWEEMMATFNMGIGMALVCPPKESSRLVRAMGHDRIAAWPIATIEREV